MLQLHAVQTGLGGAPYYYTFNFGTPIDPSFSDYSHTSNRVQTFMQAIEALMAPGQVLQVDPTIADIDPATGEVLDVKAFEQPAIITDEGGTAIPLSAQINLALNTSRYIGRRKVAGRIFIGGLRTNVIAGNGTVATFSQNVANTAVAGLIGPSGELDTDGLCVWTRPRPATILFPIPREGLISEVVSGVSRTPFGILSSRRD
uniref:Uncharacterized protein n=1 Tax=uncultured prokaryote TaxID=198431 RepID=A0A0H5QNV2_9ZZZZ|nr:hypothetical protein [uncultured prokaryote]